MAGASLRPLLSKHGMKCNCLSVPSKPCIITFIPLFMNLRTVVGNFDRIGIAIYDCRRQRLCRRKPHEESPRVAQTWGMACCHALQICKLDRVKVWERNYLTSTHRVLYDPVDLRSIQGIRAIVGYTHILLEDLIRSQVCKFNRARSCLKSDDRNLNAVASCNGEL
jgi:hypothetical protein